MDNQEAMSEQDRMRGYRELTKTELELIDTVKAMAEGVGDLIEHLRGVEGLDQRWVSEGRTDLQKGFMSLVRSIAQPTTF